MKLKKGQRIRAQHKETGISIIGTIIEVDGMSVQNNRVTVVTPDYKQKTIDILQFVIEVLPLLEAIWLFVRRLFSKKSALLLLMFPVLLFGQEMKLIEPIEIGAKMNEAQASRKAAKFLNWGIEKLGVDSLIFSGLSGKGVKVCICDTGSSRHSKARYNIKSSVNYTTDSVYYDLNGHSTHVAGIIVEGAYEVDLYFAKVLNEDGGGSYEDVARGIRWCTLNGVDIINLSLAGGRSVLVEEALRDARDAGAVIIAAAGNQGGQEGNEFVLFPAALDSVVAVGSVDRNLQWSYFSSVGSLGHITGPGEEIISHGLPDSRGNDTYIEMSGTSMSAPFVTMVTALLIEYAGNIDNIEGLIDFTAKDLMIPGFDPFTFHGLINHEMLFDSTLVIPEEVIEPIEEEPIEEDEKEPNQMRMAIVVVSFFISFLLVLLVFNRRGR